MVPGPVALASPANLPDMRMLGLYPESNVLWEKPSRHPLGDSDTSLETTALQYPTLFKDSGRPKFFCSRTSRLTDEGKRLSLEFSKDFLLALMKSLRTNEKTSEKGGWYNRTVCLQPRGTSRTDSSWTVTPEEC